MPGQTQPIDAAIQPPPQEPLDGPLAYVWGGKMRSARQTMPRNRAGQVGSGFQVFQWTVDIYLSYETVSDTTNAPQVDQEFPLVVDAVIAALQTDPMPVFLIDPTTGVQTQLTSIGEQMTLTYPPEVTPGSMQLVYYSAKLSTLVVEAEMA